MAVRRLELTEETDTTLAPHELSEEEAKRLHERFGSKIVVDFPTAIRSHYILRPGGWIGQIALSPDLVVVIRPKVPIQNVFGMLEYAYNLKSFEILPGVAGADSIDDLFEKLASILAKRVLDRARKGLHRDYIEYQEQSRYLRGRLMFAESLRRSMKGTVGLSCEFEEHTADLEDNQILAWTLYRISRFQFRRREVQLQVERACRTLMSEVDLCAFDSRSCLKRFYHRLNSDYRPMHALCHFFLEQCGPREGGDSKEFLPFLLNMPALFELFVARWLKAHLPPQYRLESQFKADVHEKESLSFRIDLVLRDALTDEVLAVMDTKYTRSRVPKESEIQQIVAYAARMRTSRGVLIYPSRLSEPQAFAVGEIGVASFVCDIESDLSVGGRSLLGDLELNVCPGH